jgi:hypothetical protein
MMNRSTSQALAEIAAILHSIDHPARAGLDHQSRLDLITLARSTARIMTNLVSVLVAEAEDAGSAKAAAGTPTRTWLTRTGSTGAGEAAGVVKTSQAVTASPAIREAALAGVVDGRQARAIGKVMSELPADMTADQHDSAEAFMVHRARTTAADRLVKLRSDALAAAGYQEEQGHARLVAQERRARARRSLSWWDDGDGSVAFKGSLPVVDAEPLVKIITAYTEADRRRGREFRDPLAEQRTLDQLRADAFTTLVKNYATATRSSNPVAGAPGVAGDRPRIVVTVRESDLRDRAEAAGLLESGDRISAGELRRLCCDADLLPVVLGTRSEVLDVGREQRLVTPPIRAAMTFRDGGCVFPDCTVPSAACDAHHIVPWWQGGDTSLSNLVTLCAHHHRLVEPSRLRGTPDDRWELRPAGGPDPGGGWFEVIPPARMDPQRQPIPCQTSPIRRQNDPASPRTGSH